MKFCLIIIAMSVMGSCGRSRVGSRRVSRSNSMASRRMLLSRSGKFRGKSRGKSRRSDGTIKVVMSDVDWRVCLFGIFVGIYFMYVIY